MRSVAVPAFLAGWWTAVHALGAPPPSRAEAPARPGGTKDSPRVQSGEVRPPSRGCTLEFEGGPRGGLTVNDDQWVLGAHLRLGFLCLGGFAVETAGHLGFGGNYLTL